ncbi:MAG: PQQ-binding-like beta-propeller repeat protein [Ignavibacteria bacterium]
MKTICIIFFCLIFVKNHEDIYAQNYSYNWSTVGGNSNRTGFNNGFYTFPNGDLRIYNAPNTIWGMQIFTNNNRIATTRYVSLNPLKAIVAAFNSFPHDTIWTFGSENGVFVVMGFNDNKVYVRDFRQNGNDSIFALNAENGSVVWRSDFTVERGIIWTAVFADNGDLILPGSGSKRIMRINHVNGDTVWTNSRIIPNTGAENMCVNGNTLYAWQGGLTTPKTIIAIDINTGLIKYSSNTLPGDGDQEIPMTVSGSGVIYCIRDGGLMYALKDNGNGFTELWNKSVPHPVGTYTQIGINRDSTIYIPFGKKIYRLDHTNGNAIDSSAELISSGTMNPRFAFDHSKYVYIGNGASDPSQGKYFFLNENLQILLKEIQVPYNYYSGPVAGGELSNPKILLCGAGNEIRSYEHFVQNISGTESQSPDQFTLHQNFPNPYNPRTVINYELRVTDFVKLNVFDVLGNEVADLVNEKQNAGSYSVTFDGNSLSSGVYFYRLDAGDFSETKRMILTK